MISLTDKEQDVISEIVLLSNTPHFLFKSMIDSGIPYDIKARYSRSLIMRRLKQLSTKKHPTAQDALLAYSLLISLVYMSPSDISELDIVNLNWLNWYSTIREIVKAKGTSDAWHQVSLSYPVTASFASDSSDSDISTP